MTDSPVPVDDSTPSFESPLPLPELTRGLPGRWSCSPPREVGSVRIDSRECGQGDLFVALQGENTHGHEFVEHARENGAVAAVVERTQNSVLPQFVVDDSRRALRELAGNYRRSTELDRVIGVTGSCGKTTVKEMLGTLLEKRYDVGKTPGNYNNELGLPLTLLNQGRGELLVAEVGINRPGEMEPLAELLQPDLGVITHIGPAHLEGLRSTRTVAREKSRLLTVLPADGDAFYPTGIKHRSILDEACPLDPTRVGEGTGSDVRTRLSESGDSTTLDVEDLSVKLPFQGEGLVMDAALAVAVARRLGVRAESVRSAMETFHPLPGRGRRLTVRGCEVIDGSYNANPESMEAALQRLVRLDPPRLALVGEMKEMGERAEEAHRRLGELLAAIPRCRVHYVGQYRATVGEGFASRSGESFHAHADAEQLPELPLEEYGSCLVKASHGVGLHRRVEQWRDTPRCIGSTRGSTLPTAGFPLPGSSSTSPSEPLTRP